MFNEWSLILFTVLVQMAAGALLLAPAIRMLAPAGCEQTRSVSRAVALTAAPVMVVAVGISLLHLGTPMNAPKTLLHLGSSWLSREILFTGLLAFCAVLLAVSENRSDRGASQALRVASSLAAAACLAAMTNVYLLRTVPVWNGPLTPLAFVAAAVLLGSALLAVASLGSSPSGEGRGERPLAADDSTRLPFAMTFTACLLAVAALAVHAVALALSMPEGSVPSGTLLLVGHLGLLALCAMALVAAALRSRTPEGLPAARRMAWTGLALAVAGELAGRMLFFGMYARVGL